MKYTLHSQGLNSPWFCGRSHFALKRKRWKKKLKIGVCSISVSIRKKDRGRENECRDFGIGANFKVEI